MEQKITRASRGRKGVKIRKHKGGRTVEYSGVPFTPEELSEKIKPAVAMGFSLPDLAVAGAVFVLATGGVEKLVLENERLRRELLRVFELSTQTAVEIAIARALGHATICGYMRGVECSCGGVKHA